jgi:3-oxo-5-alpha-steroid 4-dehydrogenase 1
MSLPPVSPALFQALLVGWLAVGAAVFVALLFVAAPYGRHGRPGWGPLVGASLGWTVMEAPAVVVMAWLFFTSERSTQPVAIAFLVLWEVHYAYRALVAPLRLAPGAAPMPVAVMGMGFLFNLVNGWLQGEWLFRSGPLRQADWLAGPAFLTGAALFVAGMVVNRRADAALRGLRPRGDAGYHVPRGELFELVSCPNYLGEIVEWGGWALATWSLAGLAFAFWTTANLLPRALAHHRWYRARFPDYPARRRAIVPWLL